MPLSGTVSARVLASIVGESLGLAKSIALLEETLVMHETPLFAVPLSLSVMSVGPRTERENTVDHARVVWNRLQSRLGQKRDGPMRSRFDRPVANQNL